MERTSMAKIRESDKSYIQMDKYFELHQPVTPYICSTPGDFQEERNWLATHVFPHLAEICRTRGTYLSPVDVCWSLEDNNVQDGQLLRLLLDLVCRSSPYFLCLLGERYGPYRSEDCQPIHLGSSWSKSGDVEGGSDWLDINFVMAARGGHEWVLQGDHQNCSIPELEIIAAAFLGNSQHCTFYFRQADHLEFRFPHLSEAERQHMSVYFTSESEHASLKVQALQQCIVKKGFPVHYFKTLDELGRFVLDDWTAILDMVFPPLINNGSFIDTAQYMEWLAHEAVLVNLRSQYIESSTFQSVLQKLTDFALSVHDKVSETAMSDVMATRKHHQSAADAFRKLPPVTAQYHSILLLSGDRGVGKSTALARWLKEFEDENSGIFLIHHFIGALPGDNDISVFMSQCVRRLRRHFLLTEVSGILGDKDENSMWWSEEDNQVPTDFQELCQAFLAAIGLGPCILLIDGINELSTTVGLSQQQVKEFRWLPFPLPPHCRLIFSTTRSDLTNRALCHRPDVKVVTLPSLSDSTLKMSYLQNRVSSHVKPLVKRQQHKICEMRMLLSPLALTVLGSEVNYYSTYTNLDVFIEKHLETGTLRSFLTQCIQQWIEQHSWIRDDDLSDHSKNDGIFDYTGWVADALCLLALSLGGLQQEELLELLGDLEYVGAQRVDLLHWLQFYMHAGALLWVTVDGRIRFTHQHIQDLTQFILLRSVSSSAVDLKASPLLKDLGSKGRLHAKLADFFARQPLSWRQVEELPWHFINSGNTEGLLAYLSDANVVRLCLARREAYPDMHITLQKYWLVLEQQGHRAGSHYLRMLFSLGLYTLPAMLPDLEAPPSISFAHSELADLDSALQDARTKTATISNTTYKIQDGEAGTDIFLTSVEETLVKPEIIDDSDTDDQKEQLASLTWAVADFLLRVGQVKTSMLIFRGLQVYLQSNFPLSIDSQILLVRTLECLGSLLLLEGDSLIASDLFHQALSYIVDLATLEENLCDHRLVSTIKGRLLGHHGYIQMQNGEFQEAGDLLKEALETISHLTGNHVLRSTLLHHLGLLRWHLSDFAWAESSLRQSLALRQQWFGRIHPAVADVLVALARSLNIPSYSKKHEQQDAEALYHQALKIRECCHGNSDVKVAEILTELGDLIGREASPQAKSDARVLLQRALDIYTTDLSASTTKAQNTRQCLRHLDISLHTGHHESVPSHHKTYFTPHLSKTLPHKQPQHSQGIYYSSDMEAGKEGKVAVSTHTNSRESVLIHNRPESMLSVLSACSPSERLLASRQSSRLRPSSRVTSAGSFSLKGIRNLAWSGDKTSTVSQNLGNAAHTEGGSMNAEKQQDHLRKLEVRITDMSDFRTDDMDDRRADLKKELGSRQDSYAEHLDEDVKHEDQSPIFAKATSRKRHVTLRPSSTPHLYQRHVDLLATTDSADKFRKHWSALSDGARCTGSAQSHMTLSSISGASHFSRCCVPGPHDIHPSNVRTLHGPHSHLQSLLGPPSCQHEEGISTPLYRSAWYHVPGRYPTPKQRYPPRRSQQTKTAHEINSFLLRRFGQIYSHESKSMTQTKVLHKPFLGVSQHDVTMLVEHAAKIQPKSDFPIRDVSASLAFAKQYELI